jgi:hypothetical protein
MYFVQQIYIYKIQIGDGREQRENPIAEQAGDSRAAAVIS